MKRKPFLCGCLFQTCNATITENVTDGWRSLNWWNSDCTIWVEIGHFVEPCNQNRSSMNISVCVLNWYPSPNRSGVWSGMLAVLTYSLICAAVAFIFKNRQNPVFHCKNKKQNKMRDALGYQCSTHRPIWSSFTVSNAVIQVMLSAAPLCVPFVVGLQIFRWACLLLLQCRTGTIIGL